MSLKIYQWEWETYKPYHEVKLNEKEQFKIMRKLSRHFFTKLANKKNKAYLTPAINVKQFVRKYTPKLINSPYKKGGMYSPMWDTITVGNTTSLSILIHEFVHHLCSMKYGLRVGHHKKFKKELVKVYKYAKKFLPLSVEEVVITTQPTTLAV